MRRERVICYRRGKIVLGVSMPPSHFTGCCLVATVKVFVKSLKKESVVTIVAVVVIEGIG